MGQIVIVSKKLIYVIAAADNFFIYTSQYAFNHFRNPYSLYHSILLSGNIDLPNAIGIPQ